MNVDLLKELHNECLIIDQTAYNLNHETYLAHSQFEGVEFTISIINSLDSENLEFLFDSDFWNSACNNTYLFLLSAATNNDWVFLKLTHHISMIDDAESIKQTAKYLLMQNQFHFVDVLFEKLKYDLSMDSNFLLMWFASGSGHSRTRQDVTYENAFEFLTSKPEVLITSVLLNQGFHNEEDVEELRIKFPEKFI